MIVRKEVKNSWGTAATNDQFIKAKTKFMHGFMLPLLKALRLVRQNREVAMNAITKVSELDRDLAECWSIRRTTVRRVTHNQLSADGRGAIERIHDFTDFRR